MKNTIIPHITDELAIDRLIDILNKGNSHARRLKHPRSLSENPREIIIEETNFKSGSKFYIDYLGDFYRILRYTNSNESDILGWHEVAFGRRGHLPFMFCTPYRYDPNNFNSELGWIRYFNGPKPTGDPDVDTYFSSKGIKTKLEELRRNAKWDELKEFYSHICNERRFKTAVDNDWLSLLNWMFTGLINQRRVPIAEVRNKQTGRLNKIFATCMMAEPAWSNIFSDDAALIYAKTDDLSFINEYNLAKNKNFVTQLENDYFVFFRLLKYGFVFRSLESVPAAIEKLLVHRNYTATGPDQSYFNIKSFLKEHPMTTTDLNLLDYLSSISTVSELSRFMTTRHGNYCSTSSGTMYMDTGLGQELFKDDGLFSRTVEAIHHVNEMKKTFPEIMEAVNSSDDPFGKTYRFVKSLCRHYNLFRKLLFDLPDHIKFRSISWNPEKIREDLVFGIEVECSGQVYTGEFSKGKLNIVHKEDNSVDANILPKNFIKWLEDLSSKADEDLDLDI